MWAATKGAQKRIQYNEQFLYDSFHDYTEKIDHLFYVLSQVPLAVSLIFASLQHMKVDRYAGQNQPWSVKALTES